MAKTVKERRHPDQFGSYLLEGIPRDLMERARQRLDAEFPPRSFKYLLLELLYEWDITYKPPRRPWEKTKKQPADETT